MNTDKLYHINNFNAFNNIFVIYRKENKLYTEVMEEEELSSDDEIIEINNKKYKVKTIVKYIPVYGHYFNGHNHFIAKKIFNHQIEESTYPNTFLIIKNKELLRAKNNGGLYIGKNIDDLYNIIDLYKKANT